MFQFNHRTTSHLGLRATARCLVIALVAAGLGLALSAELAKAGTYDILICADPANSQGLGHTDGWTQFTENQFYATSTSCSGTVEADDGIQAYNVFASRADAGSLYVSPGSKLTFTAPADTRIKKLDLYRVARMVKNEEANGWVRIITAEDALLEGTGNGYSTNSRGNLDSPFGSDSRVIFENLDTAGFSGYVGCPNGCQEDDRGRDVQAHNIDFRLFGGAVILDDASAPTVSAPTVSEGDDALITFESGDKGGGLVEAKLEYDGVIGETFTLPDNNGRCAKPYKHAVPCVLSGNGHFSVSSIPDGTHNMRVRAYDAGGNETIGPETEITIGEGGAQEGAPVSPEQPTPAAREISADGASPAEGGQPARGRRAAAPAAALIRIVAGRDGSRRLRLRAGRTAVVRGRLLDDYGDPIAGAVLEVLAAPRARRSQFVQTGELVRTGSDGGFSYLVAPGSSRTLRFSYRSAAHFAVRDIEVLVRGSATLRASRRALRNGQSVLFAGRISGGTVPRGKLVQLQVRVGRAWRTFAVVRTRARGGFRHRYRFTRTRRTTTYRFRALVPAERGYPYAGARSPGVRVRVRGG